MPELISGNAAPVIETERLVLRGHRMDDFADCAAMWADPQVARFIGGKPLSETEAWARFLRYAGHWPLMGFGYWAVIEKGSGAFVGDVGFADYKRDIEPSIKGEAEIGWVLAGHAHGKGYATEAVRAALAWGDAHLKQPRTVCIIAPENLASIRVAAKCGLLEFERAVYKDHPVILCERQRA
jgi:RimJ/RimL family protein N-acetyltransferase